MTAVMAQIVVATLVATKATSNLRLFVDCAIIHFRTVRSALTRIASQRAFLAEIACVASQVSAEEVQNESTPFLLICSDGFELVAI